MEKERAVKAAGSVEAVTNGANARSSLRNCSSKEQKEEKPACMETVARELKDSHGTVEVHRKEDGAIILGLVLVLGARVRKVPVHHGNLQMGKQML